MSLRLFTSESVTEGHPDKISDQISDAVLDAMLTQDTEARVAVETLVTTGLVHVAGEVKTRGYVEIPNVVRKTLLDIGYNSSVHGFDGEFCGVSISVGEQSPEIYEGVFQSLEVREGTARDARDAGRPRGPGRALRPDRPGLARLPFERPADLELAAVAGLVLRDDPQRSTAVRRIAPGDGCVGGGCGQEQQPQE